MTNFNSHTSPSLSIALGEENLNFEYLDTGILAPLRRSMRASHHFGGFGLCKW